MAKTEGDQDPMINGSNGHNGGRIDRGIESELREPKHCLARVGNQCWCTKPDGHEATGDLEHDGPGAVYGPVCLVPELLRRKP